jgi:hypothetical protein
VGTRRHPGRGVLQQRKQLRDTLIELPEHPAHLVRLLRLHRFIEPVHDLSQLVVLHRIAFDIMVKPDPLAAEKFARASHVDGHLRTTPSCQTTPPPPLGNLRNSHVRPI